MEKYAVYKGPYLRSADKLRNTNSIMNDLLIALSPATLFAIYKNVIKVFLDKSYTSIYQALYPLILLIISPIFSLLLEMLCLYIMHKKDIDSNKNFMSYVKNGFGIFPGLFIVLISPSYTPIWVMLISIAVAVIVGKMLFGGFGQNIFNPALVGRGFMAFTFSNEISNAYLTPSENLIDAFNGATALVKYGSLNTINYANTVQPYGNLLDFFLGTVPGAFAETSFLAILIGAIYLIIRRVIDWKVPTIYLGSSFLITLIIGLRMGQGVWYPTFMILSGGLMFGACFMATEPVTQAKTDLGRIMMALLLGPLTILFRLVGNLPEGVATAILTMNIFTLAINKYTIHLRIEGKMNKKAVPGLVIFLLIFTLLFTYDIILGVK